MDVANRLRVVIVVALHFALAWNSHGDMAARLVETLPFRLDELLVRSLVSGRLVWM